MAELRRFELLTSSSNCGVFDGLQCCLDPLESGVNQGFRWLAMTVGQRRILDQSASFPCRFCSRSKLVRDGASGLIMRNHLLLPKSVRHGRSQDCPDH